jgi:hypothetical protein
MKVIATAWQDYVSKVLPADVYRNSVQYVETQKAFYAGAGCLLDSLVKVLGPGQEPTESDLLIMDGIAEEFRQFIKDVQKS